MGEPKFPSKKYDSPNHPWKAERISEEKDTQRTFGLKNKREIWKAKSLLRNFRNQARSLAAARRTGDLQAEKETEALMNRLDSLGILSADAQTSDVLAISVESILNRRLQTVVYHLGLANTPKQARQFIVHGHISIGDRKVTVPGYLVKRKEEPHVQFHLTSAVANENHPARTGKQDQEEGLANTPEEAAEAKAEAPKETKKDEAPAEEAKPEEVKTEAPAESKPEEAKAPAEEAKPEEEKKEGE